MAHLRYAHQGFWFALGSLLLVALPGRAAPPEPAAKDPKQPVQELIDKEFRVDTETREQAKSNRYIAERTEQVLNNFVDIGGYMRSGYGRNGEGGPMVGFQAPGAATKYRLGNEAETYGELIIGKNFYLPGVFNPDEAKAEEGALKGPIARVQVRLSFFNPYSAFGSSDSTSVGVPEAWASIGNVLPFAPSMKFWAGNRFYRRHDIHILDFFYWNTSGGGGGVEDVPIGPGKLALAWIGWGSTSGLTYVPEPDPLNKAGFTKSTVDLRAYDLPFLCGNLELGLAYAHSVSGVDQLGRQGPTSRGFATTLVHTIPHFISDDGVQKLSVQYGTGPARTFTAGFDTASLPEGSFIQSEPNAAMRLRITESFTANVNEYFSLGPVVVFQLSRDGTADNEQKWVSVGARPIIHFTRQLSLAFDGGIDWVKDSGAATEGMLAKATVAPQISIGNRWASRPVIRAFVTGAWWSDDFKGRVGGVDYANSKDGVNAGLQMEAWW